MLRFRASDHSYWYAGRRVPSVTRILERAGHYAGMGFVSDADLDRTGSIGDRVHAAVHRYHAEGRMLTVGDPEIGGYLGCYRLALELLPIEVLHTEVPVGNERVGGTLDQFGRFAGEWAVGDVKTGTHEDRDTWALQTAAYAWLASEMFSVRVTRRYVLRLFPDGKLPRHIPFDDPTDELRFLHLLERHAA